MSKNLPMQFILTGFTHDTKFRIFAFERIGDDKLRTMFAVRADLALTRRYSIRVQELPLLCRALLERNDCGQGKRAFTFTEADMSLHEKGCIAARRAASRKTPRRFPRSTIGAAWRNPQAQAETKTLEGLA